MEHLKMSILGIGCRLVDFNALSEKNKKIA